MDSQTLHPDDSSLPSERPDAALGENAPRAYEPPALDVIGSVPRLTGGSDFFGDMTTPE